MRVLSLVVLALLLAGLPPARAGAPVRLAMSRYADVEGDRGAERLASYTASLIDEVVPRAAELTGTTDVSPVTVVLYRDHHRFAAAVGPEYASAAGVTTYPAGLIRLDVSRADLDDIRHVIPHETAHVLVGRAVGSSYPGLAVWFNEGVAELAAGPYPAHATREAISAFTADQALPLADLDRALQDPGSLRYDVPAAYAQALSLVRFLQDRSGGDVVAKLLAATRRQGAFAPALQEVTGLTPEVLEQEWRASLTAGPSWVRYVDVDLLMWAAMVVLLIAAVVRFQVMRRRRAQEEEAEDVV